MFQRFNSHSIRWTIVTKFQDNFLKLLWVVRESGRFLY